MQQFTELQHVKLEDSWLTIGVFDGVHRGHRAIIEPLVAGAKQDRAPSVVITFDPHPASVFAGPRGNFLLTDIQERTELIAALGVDVFVALPFSQAMATTPAGDFLDQLQAQLELKHLSVGYDFAMGRNREGDVSFLREQAEVRNFAFREVAPVKHEGAIISSTLIRERLLGGELSRANDLLGRPYSLRGRVVPGDGRGRTIGIPTANLEVPIARLVPANGVYACRVGVDKYWIPAVTNVGVRPTFNEGELAPRVEAHLLDFEGDLYGKQIELQFVARLRPEKKFDGISALVAQIEADIEEGRAILTRSESQ
jgi:riboflavin kinase/FMN adenylyltransferase